MGDCDATILRRCGPAAASHSYQIRLNGSDCVRPRGRGNPEFAAHAALGSRSPLRRSEAASASRRRVRGNERRTDQPDFVSQRFACLLPAPAGGRARDNVVDVGELDAVTDEALVEIGLRRRPRSTTGSWACLSVMAGLDPAIHVFLDITARRGCPAQACTRAGRRPDPGGRA